MTGKVDGGWQGGASGHADHFVSQPDQTWSATAYLRLIHEGLFGLTFTDDSYDWPRACRRPGGR